MIDYTFDVIPEVASEIVRAHTKHGDWTPLNPEMDRKEKLVILTEELGEVAKCLAYDQKTDGLKAELIQLAAMTLLWAICESESSIKNSDRS